MDLSNISSGLIIKNYKELCLLLNDSVKTGNAKKSQLKEWERYFSFHKEGNKYVIEEIYSKPLEKNDKRDIDYIVYIEQLILDLLAQDRNNGKVVLSKHGLLKVLNMINSNYSYGKRNIPKLSKLIEIDEKNIYEFYESANNTLIRNIESTLKRLVNKSLISWQPVKTVCIASVAIERNDLNRAKITSVSKRTNEYDEEILEFNATYRVNKSYREATEEEDKLILHTERKTMKKMKCEGKQEIIKKGLWEEFNKRVKDILFEKANILFYFDSYKILFNEDHVLEERDRLENLLLDDIERIINQETLNNSVMDRFLSNAENRQDKAIEKNCKIFGISKDETLNRRIDENYIDDNKKLISTLIDSKHTDIKKEIRKTKV